MQTVNKPTLTIIMPTYNKKQYIGEALDSIFMQKTTYNYEIIVADDASNDGTLDIVQSYSLKYPNKIKLLESKANQKLFKNILRAYAATKTDYFCVLDPDDYWIDEEKIQKALNFLEENRDFTIYTANTNMLYSNGTTKQYITARTKVSDFKDYLQGRVLLGHTSSCVFRNVIFKDALPSKLTKLECESNEVSFRGDSFRNLIHIHKGKAFFQPEIDSVYRITQEGIWQSLDDFKQMLINCIFHKDMWLFFDKEHIELLRNSYKTYQKMLQPDNIQNQCLKNRDEFIENMNKIYDLGNTYQPHIDKLSEKNKPDTTKHKIFLSCYEYLHKKLAKRGFI